MNRSSLENEEKKRGRRGGTKIALKKGKMQKIEKIKIGHMNIRGIKSKIKDIASLAEEQKYDVMIFTETKLKKGETRKIP